MDSSVGTDCGSGVGWAEEGKGGKVGQLSQNNNKKNLKNKIKNKY